MLLFPKDEIGSLCLLVVSLQTKGNRSVISHGLSLNILLQMFSTIFVCFAVIICRFPMDSYTNQLHLSCTSQQTKMFVGIHYYFFFQTGKGVANCSGILFCCC